MRVLTLALVLVWLPLACREAATEPAPVASTAAPAQREPVPELQSVPVPALGAARPLLFVIETSAQSTPPVSLPTLVVYEDGAVIVRRTGAVDDDGTGRVLGRVEASRAKALSDEIAREMEDVEWRHFTAARSGAPAPMSVHVRRNGRWFRLTGYRIARGFVAKGEAPPPALARVSQRLGEVVPDIVTEWKPAELAILLSCGGTARTTPPPWPASLPKPPSTGLGDPLKAPYVHVVGGEHEARVRELVGESGWTTVRHADENCTVSWRRRVPAEDHLDRVIAAFQKTPK